MSCLILSDGVAAQEGNLLFMTTNKLELLDRALIRPGGWFQCFHFNPPSGRVDQMFFFDLASKEQARELFSRFYGGCTSEQAESFAEQIPDHTLSMAELQGFLLQRKNQPARALEDIVSFVRGHQPHRQRVPELAVHSD